ncbi:MAG: neutral/alkaline non-lysosomal ceramidase N-terminal domain-containing protein [Pirellulaceae bacterium]|nr:neutral/alkaline non-lysosomal ceramidase N-terminal domain-containing protein [Pirellulaceae bacterium]
MTLKCLAICLLLMPVGTSFGNTPIGIAKVDVTPTGPVLLAGYGARTTEHQGIDERLWARALVIGGDSPVAIVVVDNCGVPASVKQRLVLELEETGITADRLVLAATHTHNAPTLTDYATILWKGRTTPEQDHRVRQYTEFLISKSRDAVLEAYGNREPMQLEWTQGRAEFGGNRRKLNNGKWAGFGYQRNSPVDHSLPILAARDLSGKLRAVWANYACHCTTVGSRNRVGGDWAGYANDGIESSFPDSISLITIGCGADIGPQPTGNLQLAKKHGQSIAKQVKLALAGKTQKLQHAPQVKKLQVKLPLAKARSRAEWEKKLNESTDGFHRQHAQSMLTKLDQSGSLPDSVDYTVSSWTFDDELAILFLGGEVVVDYAVRLNQELDWSRLWITAWANSMPGYIPSRRVLLEGGYEADFSQIYYDQPAPYALQVEDVLVASIVDFIGDQFAAKATQTPAPFHQPPSGADTTFRKVQNWSTAQKPANEVEIANWIRRQIKGAKTLGSRLQIHGGATTDWHNFAGDFTQRSFIRQQSKGNDLQWQIPRDASHPKQPTTVCFTGGVGWLSEPKTGGFLLTIDSESPIQFDVTRKPAHWRSADGHAELIYLPTWLSDVDSAGFFFLHLKDSPNKVRMVRVKSLGEDSKRWFAIDSNQQINNSINRLNEALNQTLPSEQP